jgi:hypothetical protein
MRTDPPKRDTAQAASPAEHAAGAAALWRRLSERWLGDREGAQDCESTRLRFSAEL